MPTVFGSTEGIIHEVESIVKKITWLVVGLGLVSGVGVGVWQLTNKTDPRGNQKSSQIKNLERYDFDYLKNNYQIDGEYKLEILGKINEVEDRRASFAKATEGFNFDTRQIRFLSNGKWITGMMNYYPERSSLSKVIIMVRGYAEVEGYYSGSGTWRVADELTKAGYATISIDFLGYGGSEGESTDILEARFEKVVNLLDLIETVKTLPWVDKEKIGIWAHSNGGQIVLSVLEITGENYPTVLWAPMTQKFPESVLSTIDEGSPVKQEIENFMGFYDARRYAFENYLEWINAPVLIIQGTADEWCEVEWQEKLVRQLADLGKKAELGVYPGADHNLKGSWDEAVERTKEWFSENL